MTEPLLDLSQSLAKISALAANAMFALGCTTGQEEQRPMLADSLTRLESEIVAARNAYESVRNFPEASARLGALRPTGKASYD